MNESESRALQVGDKVLWVNPRYPTQEGVVEETSERGNLIRWNDGIVGTIPHKHSEGTSPNFLKMKTNSLS